jgi:hypothetical protein
MELTRIRRMRDAMILAERRKELIEMEVMQRQAAAMFVACSKNCTKKNSPSSHKEPKWLSGC